MSDVRLLAEEIEDLDRVIVHVDPAIEEEETG